MGDRVIRDAAAFCGDLLLRAGSVAVRSMTKTIKFPFMCETAGDGLWSSEKTIVSLDRLELDPLEYEDEPVTFGELRVYFDVRDWHVREDGLIYTDSKFLAELRDSLREYGFSEAGARDVHYSEQGMQGDDYVSCDIGEAFIADWRRLTTH